MNDMSFPSKERIRQLTHRAVAEYFSEGLSVEAACRFVNIRFFKKEPHELLEEVGEHDPNMTPVMLYSKHSVFGGYEVDFDVSLNSYLRDNLRSELIFTACVLTYMDSELNLEYSKIYIYDYVSDDPFASICDTIRIEFNRLYDV